MRKREAASFADLVHEVKLAPGSPEPEPRPEAVLTDPDGEKWHEVAAEISPEQARDFVLGGARLAWDDCGSRGYAAPIDWIGMDEARALAAAGRPTLRINKRHRAQLSEWASGRGERLVLASMSVQWGRRLA